MNAGRDVERLIADWLVDEAAPGAPDRVLESARQVVRRTNQRRFAAIWRDTMFSPYRPLLTAATLVVAVVGGALIGRLTAPSGVGTNPPTPAASIAPSAPPSVTLETYRAARNAICQHYVPLLNAQRPLLEGIYDAGLTPNERAPKAAALSSVATILDETVHELDGLDVPPALAADHAAQLAYYRSTIALIRAALDHLGSLDLKGAETLDLATDPNSRAIEAFESKYALEACP